MLGTLAAIGVLAAVAAALTYCGHIAAGTRRDTNDLARPLSRQALERLRDGTRDRNGTA